MSKIIGIDLGTSNSAAAVMVGGKHTIIQAAEGTSVGGKAFPSVVAFIREGHLIVGEPAKRQMISNPEGTVLRQNAKWELTINLLYLVKTSVKSILHNKYLHSFYKR